MMGYRAGAWNGDWPHLDETQRRGFARRIWTIRWGQVLEAGAALRAVDQNVPCTVVSGATLSLLPLSRGPGMPLRDPR